MLKRQLLLAIMLIMLVAGGLLLSSTLITHLLQRFSQTHAIDLIQAVVLVLLPILLILIGFIVLTFSKKIS
ncbi:MAG: hypothetical protein Tsb005_04480 [Gammaproteobacteria bacterium]